MSKLCLGTVQFGLDYGINNKFGKPSKEECFEMLDIALHHDIKKIDTAAAYGMAEELLGDYIVKRKLKNKVEIITKLTPNIIEKDTKSVQGVIRDQIKKSLKKLNVERLDGYLLHTPGYIYREDILESLLNCKMEGLVKNIGVSIYEMEDGFAAIQTNKVDYIQLPYSIFDQRGERTNFLSEAKKKNVTIFTRSAFLQGLILMDKEEIPSHIFHAKRYIEQYERLLDQYKIEKVDGLLHFVYDNENVDYLVFGVDTKEQLLYDIDCVYNKTVPKVWMDRMKEQFREIEKSIIFPSLWAKNE